MSYHTLGHSFDHFDLNEWLSYIESIHITEIELGLSRVNQVAQKLHIDLNFAQVIIVAGTNGKGTTCAFLENVLLNEQQSVAVYSSPHIKYFNERLRINGLDVKDQLFIDAFKLIEQTRGNTSLSYYEYTTLASFLILMLIKPEVIILEVGLGGRLDATNIIGANIAVITTIDLDHQDFLGNDRETIGYEKAGVMRSNQHIIIGDIEPPISVVNHAINLQTPIDENIELHLNSPKLLIRNKNFTIEEEYIQNSWQWTKNTKGIKGKILLTGLKPPFIPIDNVATALAVLSTMEIKLTSEKVNNAIEKTKVAGRLELFEKQDLPKSFNKCNVILDVAHNPQAARYLASKLEQCRSQYRTIYAVVGMLQDKDITNTVSALVGLIEHWYIGQLNVSRAASNTLMLKELNDSVNSINCFDNVTQAFKMAVRTANKNDLILVFGSFYTIAEVRCLLLERTM